MRYLITYWYVKGQSFHYDIVDNIETWVEEMQRYDDYVLISALPVTDEFAEKWDGKLRTM